MTRPSPRGLSTHLAALGGGLLAGLVLGRARRVLPLTRQDRFSLGVYAGADPLHLSPHPAASNPVLTTDDVTDAPSEFLADPFGIQTEDGWFLFFEVLQAAPGAGVISVATSDDGLRWRYRQVVLREPFHLSYPYVFEWEGTYYMLPEMGEAQELRLYRATRFPVDWTPVATLLRGYYLDSSIVRYEDRWWIFTSLGEDNTRLYFADELQGPWREHPASPLVLGDMGRARSGGRVIVHAGRPIRFVQDCSTHYGRQVRAFVVEELTADRFREVEATSSPVLTASERGWNSRGMHQVDAHQQPDGTWLAFVDGSERTIVWGRDGRGRTWRQVARALAGRRRREDT